jgi:tripartite-type tricarboxylate transporter receptor subunit TctC
VAEFVPRYQVSDLFGLGAPKDTPAEIVGNLNAEVNAWVADPKVKARFADFGGIPVGGSTTSAARWQTKSRSGRR